MDFPLSSYHDFLKELWDEEGEPEEVETVMKVVPSIYYHYLDLLSNVQAEKLPPHRTCDDHMELDSNPSLPTIVEINASNHALGAVISQVSDSGKHHIAFDRRKLISVEVNYEIHNKELLGIVWALKRWRDFLLSLSSPFGVLTNHSCLKYFMSSKVINCCQAFWAEFHFSITHRPGPLATLLDALSGQDNIYPERGEDFISKNPMDFQQLIKQDEVPPSRVSTVKVGCFQNLIESSQKKLWQDPRYRSIPQELGKGESVQDYSLDSSS
ncbi:hypothetical protein O181_029742 [Austropuccinia psidii MF-1]|uniref:Reverse transcriptase RNase H-like domain-containing protein n=1 Tax=Austropuccinia psidii MF-1 TaxID=1389203 RepID=A0A9Q3CUD8_9BASI|nr:hypothetical protein [Austropuccinia psidii MF-1]